MGKEYNFRISSWPWWAWAIAGGVVILTLYSAIVLSLFLSIGIKVKGQVAALTSPESISKMLANALPEDQIQQLMANALPEEQLQAMFFAMLEDPRTASALSNIMASFLMGQMTPPDIPAENWKRSDSSPTCKGIPDHDDCVSAKRACRTLDTCVYTRNTTVCTQLYWDARAMCIDLL
jgi:hypothetical protein